MHLQTPGRATTRCLTTSAIAMPDKAHDARRNVLRCADRQRVIGRADVLCVALRALDGRLVHRDLLAGAFLESCVALRAEAHYDLELRAPVRPRLARVAIDAAVEDRITEDREQLGIVEIPIVLVRKRASRLPQPCNDIGR